MIEILDETIKSLLVDKGSLNLSEIDISFDVPNRDWSKSISKPTVNIYLHDIRENLQLRSYKTYDERQADGTITKVKLGGLYDLSYIITAWTTSIEDEHRILWYVLSTLSSYEILPEDILPEPLSKQPYSIMAKTAQADGVLRNAADVWTALDNQLKPVLTYVLTVAMDSRVIARAKEVRNKFIRYYDPEQDTPSRLANAGNIYRTDEPLPALTTQVNQIGGIVRDATQPDNILPVTAEVILLEQGLNVRTDERGRFTFSNVGSRTQYTILVVAPGYVTTRKSITIPASSYDVELQPETEQVSA